MDKSKQDLNDQIKIIKYWGGKKRKEMRLPYISGLPGAKHFTVRQYTSLIQSFLNSLITLSTFCIIQ